MKKLLCALLALTLLCSFAFAAEGELIPAYSIEAPENPRAVAIGETGVEISLPGSWTDVEAPEDCICAYASPDGDMTLTIALAPSQEEVYAAVREMVEAGTAKEMMEVYVNDAFYLTYCTVDDLYDVAYMPLSAEQMLMLNFAVASADVDTTVALEILGTARTVE